MDQSQRETTGHRLGRRDLIGQGLLLGSLLLVGCGRRNSAVARPPLPGSPMPSLTVLPPVQPPQAPVQAPGLVVMKRAQWTRAGEARGVPIHGMNGVQRITVHHDGMPPVALRGEQETARRIESIRASHVNARGWADIGYHYIVDPTGRVWEGRASWKQGAHVKDQNEHNIGVLVLGNFDVQRPTPQALSSLDQFLGVLMARYNVPLSRVYTHREIGQSACPGANLQHYMNNTRAGGGRLALAASRGFRA